MTITHPPCCKALNRATYTTSTGATGFLPGDTGPLVIQPMMAASLFAQIATRHRTPTKVAGLTIISREMANDSDPAVAPSSAGVSPATSPAASTMPVPGGPSRTTLRAL